jgi:hypothetical protein
MLMQSTELPPCSISPPSTSSNSTAPVRRKRKLQNRLSEAKKAFDGDVSLPAPTIAERRPNGSTVWRVPSFSRKNEWHEVSYSAGNWECSCLDKLFRRTDCKHILLVRLESDFSKRRRIIYGADDTN